MLISSLIFYSQLYTYNFRSKEEFNTQNCFDLYFMNFSLLFYLTFSLDLNRLMIFSFLLLINALEFNSFFSIFRNIKSQILKFDLFIKFLSKCSAISFKMLISYKSFLKIPFIFLILIKSLI